MQIKTQYTHWSGDLHLHAFLSNKHPRVKFNHKVLHPGKFSKVALRQGSVNTLILPSPTVTFQEAVEWEHQSPFNLSYQYRLVENNNKAP